MELQCGRNTRLKIKSPQIVFQFCKQKSGLLQASAFCKHFALALPGKFDHTVYCVFCRQAMSTYLIPCLPSECVLNVQVLLSPTICWKLHRRNSNKKEIITIWAKSTKVCQIAIHFMWKSPWHFSVWFPSFQFMEFITLPLAYWVKAKKVVEECFSFSVTLRYLFMYQDQSVVKNQLQIKPMNIVL